MTSLEPQRIYAPSGAKKESLYSSRKQHSGRHLESPLLMDSSDEYFEIPCYHSKQASTSSTLPGHVAEADAPRYKWSWAEKQGMSKNQVNSLISVRAKDDSMEPQIRAGDLLVVRSDLKQIQNGAVYAIEQDGVQRIKRLYKHDDLLLLVSDKPQVEIGPELVRRAKMNAVKIIGLIWTQSGAVR